MRAWSCIIVNLSVSSYSNSITSTEQSMCTTNEPHFFVMSTYQTCRGQGSMGVSLIPGLEYGMKQWNEKWNGMVNVHDHS